MKAAIIPGFGIVAAFGLSGTNCLLAHVSTVAIGKANQKISDWLFLLSQTQLFYGIISASQRSFGRPTPLTLANFFVILNRSALIGTGSGRFP